MHKFSDCQMYGQQCTYVMSIDPCRACASLAASSESHSLCPRQTGLVEDIVVTETGICAAFPTLAAYFLAAGPEDSVIAAFMAAALAPKHPAHRTHDGACLRRLLSLSPCEFLLQAIMISQLPISGAAVLPQGGHTHAWCAHMHHCAHPLSHLCQSCILAREGGCPCRNRLLCQCVCCTIYNHAAH